MPDETVITKEDEKKDKPLIEEIRGKSFGQILKEQAEARAKGEDNPDDKPTETEEEKKKREEDEKAKADAEEAKKKVEEEEAAKKRDADIAEKAAADVLAKQKAEDEKKAQETRTAEEAKQREEALKPKFTGKDKDGNVVPKNYDEVVAEGARIGEERALARIRQEEEAKREKEEQEKQAAAKTEEEKTQTKKAFEDQLQKEMDADLTAMYTAGDMPKIKDPKDENDPGNKEFKNLMETAQRVNAERLAKGQPLIRSLQVVRYGKDEKGQPYYKPLVAKPAGHDAPVLGNESPLDHAAPDDKYVVSRDRNKSMTQLIKEEAKRLSKRLNVRGV